MRQLPSTACVARVRSEPRSDPVSGSVNTAVGSTSPQAIPGSQRSFCAGVPASEIISPAISERVPREPAAIQARLSSSVTTHIASLPRPRPPYSGSMQMPNTPSAAISSITLSGISASAKCHLWAWGAMRSVLKRRNWSRIMFSSASGKASSMQVPARTISISLRRDSAVLPCCRNHITEGSSRNASTASFKPSSEGRKTSFWLMAMPLVSCSRYSPRPMPNTSFSPSPRRDSCSRRRPHRAMLRMALAVVAIQARPCSTRWRLCASCTSKLPSTMTRAPVASLAAVK